MNWKTIMIKHLIALLALTISAGAAAADAPSQAATCVACHGQGGVSSNPQWPSLAGQKQGYLIAQITAFRDGQRSNAMMAPMVSGLRDEDIAALAAYFSAQEVSVAASGNAALVDKGHNRAGYCVSCHGMKGITANPEWPNLAGQQAAYLENQLRAFRSGTRDSGLMQTVIANLSEQDFAALASYFSQLAQ
jgi:cytochrome c553